MKKFALVAVLVSAICSLVQAQCPTPVYGNLRPLPPNSSVFITVDGDGHGVSLSGSISITPDPSNPAPKFTLNTQTPTGSTGVMDFVNGAMNWNAQNSANGTGVSFSQGAANGSANWIVSPTWPKATVTYLDTSGHQHTTTVDFSGAASSVVAESTWLPDYDFNGNLLPTSAGGVTLINTNGAYSVPGAGTFPVWSPNGPNFDNALVQIGEHETGHGFLLGDQTSVSGDVMSTWGTSASNPGGATNNQNGHASTTITSCDDSEIQNNPNGPYQLPPPPPPPPGDCSVSGCTCGGTCNKDGSCTYTFDCSPILIAVGTDADIELTSAQDGVWFDIEANGNPQWVGWTQRGEPVAFLALDLNHDGRINDGSELFGNHTLLPNGKVAPNGFAALAAYDRPENGGNGDGMIDEHDAIWTELRLWIDWNHNGISEPNELYSLEDWRVKQISLDYQSLNRADQFGNVLRFKAPCQLAGKVRFGYDVYFTARPPRKP